MRPWISAGIALGTLAIAGFCSAGPAARPAARMVEGSPGVSLRVIDTGPKGSRLTLVLIPGWRFTADIWTRQIAEFGSRYRVVALDPRSQGASTKTLADNTPEARAEDLHAMLTRLDVGSVVLVGWSPGAQDVGAYVAKFGTGGVKGLVFVDAAPSQGWDKAVAAPGSAQQLRQLSLYTRYPREATEGMMQAVFKTPRTKAEADRLVADALKTPPTIGAAMLEDDLFGPDRMSALAKVETPALLIAADNSPNAGDLAALAKVLPKARLVSIPGAGHAVFVDQPRQFDELVTAFLGQLERGSH